MQGKEHIPTEESRKLVRSLAAVGTRYVDIAHKLEITDDTLRKHYKAELEDGELEIMIRFDAAKSKVETIKRKFLYINASVQLTF
mgnify:CR=1 FL=1